MSNKNLVIVKMDEVALTYAQDTHTYHLFMTEYEIGQGCKYLNEILTRCHKYINNNVAEPLVKEFIAQLTIMYG